MNKEGLFVNCVMLRIRGEFNDLILSLTNLVYKKVKGSMEREILKVFYFNGTKFINES